MMMMNTHPAQYVAFVGMMILNMIALVWVNRMKKQGKVPDFTWETKRKVYMVCIIAICVFNLFLDANFAIDTRVMILARIFYSVMPIGVVDLYFSKTQGVDIPGVMMGLLIHFAVNLLHVFLCYKFHGHHMQLDILQTPMALSAVPLEIGRILAAFVFSGILADLAFSPIHRYLHTNPKLYRKYHKKHHEYTNNLTCLVSFHADATDDLLMASALSLSGSLLYRLAVHSLFPGFEPFSNLTFIVTIIGEYLGHAHDARLTQLLLPGLPESLNVLAYHHDHHLSPNRNFGLTQPMDMFWDWVFGTNTIKKRRH